MRCPVCAMKECCGANMDQEIARLRAENAELRETIKRHAAAARMGMDAAKAISSGQLEQAARLRAESSPDALESEREMNSTLTKENDELRAQIAAHEKVCAGVWVPVGERSPEIGCCVPCFLSDHPDGGDIWWLELSSDGVTWSVHDDGHVVTHWLDARMPGEEK